MCIHCKGKLGKTMVVGGGWERERQLAPLCGGAGSQVARPALHALAQPAVAASRADTACRPEAEDTCLGLLDHMLRAEVIHLLAHMLDFRVFSALLHSVSSPRFHAFFAFTLCLYSTSCHCFYYFSSALRFKEFLLVVAYFPFIRMSSPRFHMFPRCFSYESH